MAKIILDTEMAEIISKAVNDVNVFECADSYKNFLQDLANLIGNHFGAAAGDVFDDLDSDDDGDDGKYGCAFNKNENTVPGGWVFADYDTDEKW